MPLKASVAERLKNGLGDDSKKPDKKPNQDKSNVPKLATIATASVFVAAGCLIFAGITHAQSSSAMSKLEEGLTTVVVAAKDIPQGAVIRESMLTNVQVPQAYLSSGVITDASNPVGKRALVRIDKNSQLRTSEVVGAGNTSSLSGSLEKEMKAVSIDVSTETDFARSLLHQGDAVSLYCFGKSNSDGAKTTCLAKDVNVIALDGYTSYADMPGEDGTVSYSNVTVEVESKTAERIRRAQSSGTSIWMILSASVDKKG